MNTYRKGCLFIIADLGWYLSCWKENKTNKKFKQRNGQFKFQRRIEVKVRHTNETCICRLEGSSWLGGVEISSSSAEKSHYHLKFSGNFLERSSSTFTQTNRSVTFYLRLQRSGCWVEILLCDEAWDEEGVVYCDLLLILLLLVVVDLKYVKKRIHVRAIWIVEKK